VLLEEIASAGPCHFFIQAPQAFEKAERYAPQGILPV
jgi:hypothetical protein